MKARVLLSGLMLVAATVGSDARANGKTPPAATPAAAEQQQTQSQQQSQTQTQTNDVGASASSATDQTQGISTNDRNLAVAFGTTAPIPIAPNQCWFPAKGFKRGHSIAWGLWQASAVLERDEQCVDDLERTRAFELERIRAEIELERARADRIERERNVARQVK